MVDLCWHVRGWPLSDRPLHLAVFVFVFGAFHALPRAAADCRPQPDRGNVSLALPGRTKVWRLSKIIRLQIMSCVIALSRKLEL